MIFLSLLLSGFLTLVELNCENLFDYFHDEGKQDEEYLPDATRHWNKKRYWRKLNHTAQTLLSASDDGIPDLIALCEVENDSVMRDLTKRSLLRNAGYEYLVTQSPDLRGIDVALLYSPFTFSPIQSYPLRVKPVENMRPTRLWFICPVALAVKDIADPFVRPQQNACVSLSIPSSLSRRCQRFS